MEQKQVIETVRANSFSGRYGGTGTDFKIYFDTEEELKKGIDNVMAGKKHLYRNITEDDLK